MKLLRSFLKKINLYFPKLVQVLRGIRNFRFLFKPINNKFTIIYSKNKWGSSESSSGYGSTLTQTSNLRQELPALIKKYHIKSLLDVPCGDFNWLSTVDLNLDEYIGGDIVSDLVCDNQEKYQNENCCFELLDVTCSHLPQVDLILCRDCLVHFSYKDIKSAIRNFKKSGATYLLTTTFITRTLNRNIITGGWRPLNLLLPPFNFPKPITIIIEGCTEANQQFFDKSLALWKLNDVSI
jgi:hypothetical protein